MAIFLTFCNHNVYLPQGQVGKSRFDEQYVGFVAFVAPV